MSKKIYLQAYNALMGMGKAPIQPDCPAEKVEHLMCMEWVRLNPLVNKHLIHIPNGEKRDPHIGSMLKAMGVKAGVSDFFLALPNGKFAGLWLELKRKKGYSIAANQEDWIKTMKMAGYEACFVFGADEFILRVTNYLADYNKWKGKQ